MNESTFRRIAAISAIISAPLMLASIIVTSMAVDFKMEFLANPVGLLTAGLDSGALELFRSGEILGLFSYCLLLIPPTIYLWYWLKPRNPGLVTLFTVLGLSSFVLGVIEYGVRISIWPAMMIAYPQAAGAQQEVLTVVFGAVTDFTFESLYAFDSILAGFWWLGIGLILRAERRILGIATVILGIAILGAGFGWLLRIDLLARLELFYFFVPFWALWLGVVIWRSTEESGEYAIEPATAA